MNLITRSWGGNFDVFWILSKFKCVLIGGGNGIGRAACQILSREGASVAIVDVNEAGAKETAEICHQHHPAAGDAQFHIYTLSVANSTAVNEMMKKIKDQFPQPLSVVVNGAGIIRDKMLWKMTEESFEEVIDVNLKVCVIKSYHLKSRSKHCV